MQLKGINVVRYSSWFALSTNGRPNQVVRGEQDALRAFSLAIDQAHVDQAKQEAPYQPNWDYAKF